MCPPYTGLYGAGDWNRTNPNEPNKGVTSRSSVQLESNGVRSRMTVNFGHRRGVSAWDREARMFATGAGLLGTACARTAFGNFQIYWAGQDGLNSFSVFLADTRSDFQRAKSREFSVTSVAPVRIASDAISRSRKWLTKSICPKVLRERRSRMPVSIQAEPGGEEKWPRALWA